MIFGCAPPRTWPITACCDQFHPLPSFDSTERLRRAENQVLIKISGGKLPGGRDKERGEGEQLNKKYLNDFLKKMYLSIRAEAAVTFDDKFSKVGDPRASGGLGDAAVQVLVRPLDSIKLEGNHEAPVAQVFDGRCC